MRKIDADHMKSRINEPKTEAEIAMVKTLTEFIDSEPSVEDEEIQWLVTVKKKHTRDCNTARYGVECSNCKHFQDLPSRYCPDCGRVYNGKIVTLNEFNFMRHRR